MSRLLVVFAGLPDAGRSTRLRVVEVGCGDPDERRRQVDRHRAERGDDAPTWEQTRTQLAGYEPYVGPRLVVDTAVDVDPFAGILSYLR